MCDFRTHKKYNLNVHLKGIHGISNLKEQSTQIQLNVQQNVSEAYSNIQNQHNTQYGTGQNTYKQNENYNENYNEDYNKMVGIAQGWKNHFEVKDNALHARDVFLTANNSKLQDKFIENKILIGQNKNIIEKNSATAGILSQHDSNLLYIYLYF